MTTSRRVSGRKPGEHGSAAESERFVPPISPWLNFLFMGYIRRYLRRHFRSVRIARDGLPQIPDQGPLVVFLNHPAWWDPLVGLYLGDRLFPGRATHAPIDRQALGRYRLFERLGFFGIQPDSPAGARVFLRHSLAILQGSDRALWITPQGSFRDSRECPPRFEPGLAYLAEHVPGCTFLPLAIEYAYWEERLAEILVRFGRPLRSAEATTTASSWNERLELALVTTQDRLAEQVKSRRAEEFQVLLSGRVGIGGIYDGGRRLRAVWRGQRFRPEHGDPLP